MGQRQGKGSPKDSGLYPKSNGKLLKDIKQESDKSRLREFK